MDTMQSQAAPSDCCNFCQGCRKRVPTPPELFAFDKLLDISAEYWRRGMIARWSTLRCCCPAAPQANLRNFAERAALNTPLQGTAADLIKLVAEGLQATMQVHDELLLEAPGNSSGKGLR